MTTSVVMSIYNGEKYIEEQLNSLMKQSREPDEVLIIDDHSNDRTCEIVENFIAENQLMHWSLIRNQKNAGWKVNFFHAMELATSDIIFPCDQDDIWHYDKLEIMLKELESNNQILVLEGKPHKFFEDNVSNDAISIRILIGSVLDKISEKKNASSNTRIVQKKKFDNDFMKRAPGCTLAIRKSFFEQVKEEWFEELPHDALATYYAKLLDGYFSLDYEVIEWRQHVGSASRPKERNREKRIEELMLDRKMIEALYKYGKKINSDSEQLIILEGAKRWCDSRMGLVIDRNVFNIFKILKYRRFYIQKRRILTDIKYGVTRCDETVKR